MVMLPLHILRTVQAWRHVKPTGTVLVDNSYLLKELRRFFTLDAVVIHITMVTWIIQTGLTPAAIEFSVTCLTLIQSSTALLAADQLYSR